MISRTQSKDLPPRPSRPASQTLIPHNPPSAPFARFSSAPFAFRFAFAFALTLALALAFAFAFALALALALAFAFALVSFLRHNLPKIIPQKPQQIRMSSPRTT
jgi:hypothetical protein